MNHAWSTQMLRLARDWGVNGYEDGTLWFREQSGVEVVVEPLLDGASLALHARLGRVGWQDGASGLADLLRLNAPSNGRCITAIDAVADDVILFRRFDDVSLPYETFVDQVRRFAQVAAEGLALQRDEADTDLPSSMHAEGGHALHHAMGEFAHARGLEPPEDANHFLVCMPGGGGISVQLDPSSGDVLLISHLGPAPTGDPALRQLLELHMLGESTGGAFFAIDEDGGGLMLHRSVGVDHLDGLELERLLSGLGATTMDCARRLGITLPRFD